MPNCTFKSITKYLVTLNIEAVCTIQTVQATDFGLQVGHRYISLVWICGASVGTSGHTEPQQLCVARSRDQLKISRISATVFPEVSIRQLARRQARPRD